MTELIVKEYPRLSAAQLAREMELIRKDVALLADGVIGFTELEYVPSTWDNTPAVTEGMVRRLGLADDDHPGHRESRA